MIRSFLVNADGSVSAQEEKPVAERRQSKLPEIIRNLKAGTSSPAEASRLVAIEIAELAIDRDECKSKAERQAWAGELKVLRALGEFISKHPETVKHDVLNLDGPKFQFFLRELIMSFEKAVRDGCGKGNETMVQKIMDNAHAKLAAGMPEFRRALEKMDLSTGIDASKSEDGKNGSKWSE